MKGVPVILLALLGTFLCKGQVVETEISVLMSFDPDSLDINGDGFNDIEIKSCSGFDDRCSS